VNILITGGCAYVGTVLTNVLLQKGHNIQVVDTMWFGNFLKPHPNLTLIKEDIRNIGNIPLKGIEKIVHLANIANDPSGDLDSKLTWEVNVLASKLLIEKAIDSGVSQLIYASSGSVYGIKEEEQVTEDLSLIPISDYNKTKMISERVLLSYSDKINLQCIRPATVCGYSPRMRLDLSVNMLTMQALKNKVITVFGGDQTRPNVHITDLVNIYLHFLLIGNKITGIFNAGFENLSILEIARMVQKRIPSEIVITESNDPRSYRLNSDKLIRSGFSPAFTVSDAITEIINEFNNGNLTDDDAYYNIRTMKQLFGDS